MPRISIGCTERVLGRNSAAWLVLRTGPDRGCDKVQQQHAAAAALNISDAARLAKP